MRLCSDRTRDSCLRRVAVTIRPISERRNLRRLSDHRRCEVFQPKRNSVHNVTAALRTLVNMSDRRNRNPLTVELAMVLF